MPLITDQIQSEGGFRTGLTVLPLANGTLALTSGSTHKQVFTGATAGQVVRLPDATTLNLGYEFVLANDSTSASFVVQDNSGALLATVVPEQILTCILMANGTAAGGWVETTTNVNTNAYVTSTTTFSTTSATDVVVTGFTFTPLAGTYFVAVSMFLGLTNNGINGGFSLYKGGVQIAESVRGWSAARANEQLSAYTQYLGSFDGATAIDVRVNIAAASTVNVNQRSMALIRIGP